MKIKIQSLVAAASAMLALATPARAAEVSYPGMTATFDLSASGTNSTAVIPLDPSGVFDGAYDWNNGDPIATTRYYSGRFATTYGHPSWAIDNAVTVNFILANGGNGGKFGIPNAGWGNIRAEFPDANGTLNSVAAPITLDYQIKLTALNYGAYEIKVFTGAAATASTEGTAAFTSIGNGPFTGSPLTSVSFSTAGVTLAGTASSSNFKSSDTWIAGEVVAGVVSNPYFDPLAGLYNTEQTVTIASNTAGATIHYTLDGSTPTTASAVYSTPLAVATSQTIKALAVKDGDTDSAVMEAIYTIKTAPPVPDLAGGAYYSKSQTVTLGSATPGAVIYYTLDGTTPTNLSTLYSAPIVISDDVTISSIAYFGAYEPSSVRLDNYIFQAQAPVFSPSGGTYQVAQNVSISANPAATIYYTSDGTEPDNLGNGTLYTTPFTVSDATTLKAIAYQTGFSPSAVATDIYTFAPLPLGISFESKASPFTVSATDLINGVTPVVVGTSASTGIQVWNHEGNTGASAVNDGVYSGRATVGGAFTGVDRAATSNAGGLDLIWNFATPQDITNLALYFSWGDGGRDNVPLVEIYTSSSEYVLTDGPNPADGQFSTAAVDAGILANGGFTLVSTTVATAPGTAPATGNNTKVNVLPELPGILASSVRSIYIRFGAAENNYVGLNEIDVFGAPSGGTPTNDYAAWATLNGVTGGASGDSDSDGIKNLVEYALADGTTGTLVDGTLSFTKRGAPYASDVIYVIEVSTDLINWTEVAATENATTISYFLDMSGGVTRKFARLRVTQP